VAKKRGNRKVTFGQLVGGAARFQDVIPAWVARDLDRILKKGYTGKRFAAELASQNRIIDSLSAIAGRKNARTPRQKRDAISKLRSAVRRGKAPSIPTTLGTKRKAKKKAGKRRK